MRLQYLWCIGLQGDSAHSSHRWFNGVGKSSWVVGEDYVIKIGPGRVFVSGSRGVFSAGAEQPAAPLLAVFPWEEEPRSGCLLGVQRGRRAASPLQHYILNIVDISLKKNNRIESLQLGHTGSSSEAFLPTSFYSTFSF